MGRHGTPTSGGAPVDDRAPTWFERLLIAALAAATITGVLRWAGAGWRTSLLAAGAVAVLVVVAAVLAATVPPPRQHSHRHEHRAPHPSPRVPPGAPPAAAHSPEPPAADPRTWPGGP